MNRDKIRRKRRRKDTNFISSTSFNDTHLVFNFSSFVGERSAFLNLVLREAKFSTESKETRGGGPLSLSSKIQRVRYNFLMCEKTCSTSPTDLLADLVRRDLSIWSFDKISAVKFSWLVFFETPEEGNSYKPARRPDNGGTGSIIARGDSLTTIRPLDHEEMSTRWISHCAPFYNIDNINFFAGLLPFAPHWEDRYTSRGC